jgi:hypothetical protein
MRGLAGRDTSFFGVFRKQKIFKTPSKNATKIAEQDGTRMEIIYVWGPLGKFATWEFGPTHGKDYSFYITYFFYFFFKFENR